VTFRDDPGPATVALYRPLLDSVPDALILVGASGTILLANAQADSMFGYARGELAGIGVDQLVPLRLRGGHANHRHAFYGDPKLRPMGARGQLYGLRKDGTEFAIAINLAPVKTEAGLVVSAAIRDVTEQRQLQEALTRKNEELQQQYSRILEASRLKSEFLANMSHELRTPLNAIIGFSEILHDGKAGELASQQQEFTGDILNSARHLLQLINDVLDLAKVEAGKMEFVPQPLNLAKLVGEVCDVVRTLLARKRLRLSTELDASLVEIVLDGGKLKQVLYNYLSNAIKFTPEGGAVTVRTVPDGPERFRLEVSDTGIGIRAEDQKRLFVEFQQLDEGLGKKHGGTGLGLALTRRIVEAQGGSVGVDSRPGRGSTFFAVLPRRSHVAEAVREAPEAPQRRPGDAPPVLVIEDQAEDRAQIESALVASGYGVEAAASGERAIALCRERPYAAITLDLMLPDMSGWDVLRAIRADGPNVGTPVIVVSVVADRAVAAAFAVQDYLIKPQGAGEVSAALRRSGVAPAPSRTVLIVDSDPRRAAELRARLEGDGYRTLHATTAEQALALLGGAPDAAVVDLHVAGGGLALLSRMRRATDRHKMPIIVSVPHHLQRAELEQLQRDSLAVVSKGHSAGQAVVHELQQMLVRPRPGPP
jgi:PAS domain S-box-containing protein